ncbi:MAG TPA: ribosome-associated translation inhibitor RaiA [Streptosporangiaceae bacterium]|nr:ribosome-associated translation inhibitor RaiA [Streptosporangiaceae bacterium]
MDIIFKARHTDVRERFRTHASAKLAKIEKLDGKAIRIDVQITAERNPRQADRRERVELTVTSRGPAIRAEAAADDRFAAFDLAFDKLESRLRRVCDRRKDRHGAHAAVRLTDLPEADLASDAELPAIRVGGGGGLLASNGAQAINAMAAAADAADAADAAAEPSDDETREVEIDMQGDGPLVVREKFHAAVPMGIDQALFEMELVGHDFFLFTDAGSGMPSVVYRRRGYQYGVIRLMEEHAPGAGWTQTALGDQSRVAGAGSGQGAQQAANGQLGSGQPEAGEADLRNMQARRGRRARAAGE